MERMTCEFLVILKSLTNLLETILTHHNGSARMKYNNDPGNWEVIKSFTKRL